MKDQDTINSLQVINFVSQMTLALENQKNQIKLLIEECDLQRKIASYFLEKHCIKDLTIQKSELTLRDFDVENKEDSIKFTRKMKETKDKS